MSFVNKVRVNSPCGNLNIQLLLELILFKVKNCEFALIFEEIALAKSLQ